MCRCSLILGWSSPPASTCRRRSSPGSRTWPGCLDERVMATLIDIAKKGRKAAAHRPWPRVIVSREAWQLAVQHLADARATMLSLWGDAHAVHLALIEEPSGEIAVFTLECRDGKFPSVAALHPAANRLERAIGSLYGLKPVASPDARPWLDLGFWGVTHPLSARPRKTPAK